jgi:hypothetical protein
VERRWFVTTYKLLMEKGRKNGNEELQREVRACPLYDETLA